VSRLLPAALLLLVAAFSRDARPADPDLQTRMATVVYRDMDYRRYACDADDCTFDEFRKHIAFRREILRAGRVGSPRPIPWPSTPPEIPGPDAVTNRSVRDNLPA
jgi:hypothetical protein